jgi:hypothetical protein
MTNPIGFATDPPEFIINPQGFATDPVGFVTETVGFTTNPIGFITDPIGFVTNPERLNNHGLSFFHFIRPLNIFHPARDEIADCRRSSISDFLMPKANKTG